VEARRQQVVLGAVAAAVLVVIVAFAASSGVKDDPRPPRPTPVPTPAAERELFGGSLEPAVRYRTRAFVPALSFEVADTEWLVRDATLRSALTLDRRRNRTARPGSELPPRAFLTFSRITQVYDPRSGRIELAPADLHAWMRRHPDLRVGRVEPETVAGVPADSFRVLVRFRRPAVSAPECVPLQITCTAIAPGRYFPDRAGMRTIVLATEPDPLVIDLIGPSDEIEGPSAPLLRSLRIGIR
jgi:hypothetical protein